MVTIKDIAKKIELSPATISRTLNNDETLSISAETRQKILITADELGYIKPKRVKKKKIKNKILVIHKLATFRKKIDSEYYFSMRAGIEETAIKYKLNTEFIPIELIDSVEEEFEGILIIGNHLKNNYYNIITKYNNIPITSIGITSYYGEIIDNITYYNKETVKMALSHLLEKGHKNIGYIGVKEVEGSEQFGSRISTFINILTEEGIINDEWIYEVVHGKDRVEKGYNAMKEWLSLKQTMPTAIFCANDPIAIGVLNALNENNIKVPDDISIISHDGSYFTKYTQPAITTINVHPYELGVEGIANLNYRINNNTDITKQIVVKPQLIIRDSVKNLI